MAIPLATRHTADSTERYAVTSDNSGGLGITIYF